MVGAVLSSWSLMVMIASLSTSSSDLSGQTSSRRHRFLNPINVVTWHYVIGLNIKSGLLFIIKKNQNSCLVSFYIFMMTTFYNTRFCYSLALAFIQRLMYIGRSALHLFVDEIRRTDTCVEFIIIYDHLLQIHFPNLECTSDDGTIGNK